MPNTAKQVLPKSVFDVEVKNHELVKRAYDAYLANARLSNASTLQRGEVRGGGKKPWRQKGTGRARHGSNRSPIWRGGGVTFGPRGNENRQIKLPTSAKRQAVRQALTLANKSEKVRVIDFVASLQGHTKDAATFLEKNNLSRNILLVVHEKTPEIMRSTNNIQNVLVVRSTYLSVYHVLNADHVIFSPAALQDVEAWLAKEDK